MAIDARAARKATGKALEKIAAAAGGHLAHPGGSKFWSACLQCRLERLARDVRSGVVTAPKIDPVPLTA